MEASEGDSFYVGSYSADSKLKGGWLVGHFMDEGPCKNENVEAKYWSFPPGETLHLPKHQEKSLEITFILKGKISGHVAGKPLELAAGQYIVIPPGVKNNIAEFAIEEVEGITIKAPSIEGDTKRPEP